MSSEGKTKYVRGLKNQRLVVKFLVSHRAMYIHRILVKTLNEEALRGSTVCQQCKGLKNRNWEC